MALGVGLIAALLAGCGGGGDETAAGKLPEYPPKMRPVTVTLAGFEGPEAAGMLMAERVGYFAKAGLEPGIYVPLAPARAVRYVVDGTDELGVAQLPQVVLAKAKGAPIVAIGSLVSQPTAAMIWLKKSKIRSIADLRGKTIAFPGVPFQREFLAFLLAKEGLTLDDVKLEKAEYDLVPDLVSGRADAIFGGSGNVEGAELEARGLEPVVTGVASLGIPAYDEQVVIARTELVAKEPELIRDFMAALVRGTAAASKNPKAAAGTIEYSGESNPEANRKETKAGVDTTLPLLSETGYVSPDRAARLIDWMLEEGMIRQELETSDLLTNDYVEEP